MFASNKQSHYRLFIWALILLLLSSVLSFITSGKITHAESGSPITVIYPAEIVSVKPNQPLYIQVAAPGWHTVEIREAGQLLGTSDSVGPNHIVAVTLQGTGIHILEATAVDNSVRSAAQSLPPIMVKQDAPDVADIVPFARQLAANTIDFNGDGLVASAANKRADLQAALKLIRPALSSAYPGPVAGYALQPGAEFGTTRIQFPATSGNRLYYTLKYSPVPIPAVGSIASGTEYIAGTDIFVGSSDYMALTEADAQGKVVRFSNVQLHDAYLMSRVSGTVSDSTEVAIAGATVQFRAGTGNVTGPYAAEAVTDMSGNYSISLPAGKYTTKLIADGYEQRTEPLSVPRYGNSNGDLTAVAKLDEGQVRIVLTWGASPEDLDAHLIGPNGSGGVFHVFYGDKRAYNAQDQEIAKLDHDDVDSYGEETVTMMTVNRNVYGTYKYYVHNYSSYEAPLVGSDAKVQLFEGIKLDEDTVVEQLIGTYHVPAGQATKAYWEVLHMNVSSSGMQFAVLNQLQDENPMLAAIDSAVPDFNSSNSLTVGYALYGGYGSYVQQNDLAISATLDGNPYVLEEVQYDPGSRKLSFKPVVRTASVQHLAVKVSASPGSSRLIPGEATASFVIPAATAITGAAFDGQNKIVLSLTNNAVTDLTLADLSVSASVYRTVTGVTYNNATLNNVRLTNAEGTWILAFDPIQQQAENLLLTVTVSASPQSTKLIGSASPITIVIPQMMLVMAQTEHAPMWARAFWPLLRLAPT